MTRVLISVEGSTEEAFCRDVLGPHLAEFDVYATAVTLTTKRTASGAKFTGGVAGWDQIRLDLTDLLRDSSAAAVTTMYDLYGLPRDVSAFASSTRHGPTDRASQIENAIATKIGQPRLRPYLQLHEFESLVFAAEEVAARRAGLPAVKVMIQKAVAAAGGPELVNDHPNTAPSKRLQATWPRYVKTIDGPAIVREAGLVSIRSSCPHFGRWLDWLEGLSEPQT
jgi:DNA-binding transcriptional regulator YdaS (Cro superfamily)